MNVIEAYCSTSRAYTGVLQELVNHSDVPDAEKSSAARVFKSAPRGQPIVEILNYSFMVLKPSSECIQTADPVRNELIKAYVQKEFALYNSGSRSAKDFAEASSFWSKIANPDGTINSAYGYLLFNRQVCGNLGFEKNPSFDNVMRTPWEWAMLALKTDKDSRQAIFHFNTPDALWLGNKDVTCTLHGQFFIRCGKLHLTITMRSNDVVLGLVYDMPWFCFLMEKALEELKTTYPDLEMGYYTHTAGSMHLYLRNLETARKMLCGPETAPAS